MGVKDARKDIKRLRDEVTALSDILTQISDLADEPGTDGLATLQVINQQNGPLQSCSDELLSLASRLDPGLGKEMKQFGLRALMWPLNTKEVDKTLTIIDRFKMTFTLAFDG